jgi:hypothetical protein
MNILLNSGWIKSLVSKAITFAVTKKAGIKADLGINELEITDDVDGVNLHLDVNVKMKKEELEKLLKDLI